MPLLTELENILGRDSTKISPLTGLAAGMIFSGQNYYEAQSRNCNMSPYEEVVARRRQQQFDQTDRRQIAALSDKDLAAWQSHFKQEEPEYRLAEHEWQCRLIAEQIRATLHSARWQAWFGIAAAIIGALVGTVLTIIVQGLSK